MNGIFGRDQRLWVWKHMWTTSSGMPADRRFTGSPSIWPTVAVDWHGPVFGTDELPGAGSGMLARSWLTRRLLADGLDLRVFVQGLQLVGVNCASSVGAFTA